MIRYLRSILFLLVTLSSLHLSAQVGDAPEYRNHFWVKWGLNSGVSWQTSDVRCKLGPGWGSTLEFPLVQSARGNVVLGIRGRYLWTRQYGQDWRRSYTADINDAVNGTYDPNVNFTPYGYYYANHRTSTHELAGELNLTFQPAYRQPGWYFNVFAGLGADKFKVNIDGYDEFFGNQYNYGIVPDGPKRDVLSQIRDMRDFSYESDAFNSRSRRWVMAPAVGVGVGYRVTPVFSLGWEYKLTFPLTDDFDGQRFEDRMPWGLKNDVYHYTQFGLNFAFGEAERSTYVSNNNVNTYDNRTPPTISVLYPTGNALNIAGNCVSDFRIKLTAISRKTNIKLTINGSMVPPSNFEYDPSSGYLTFTGYLQRGRNEVFVEVWNSDGRDTETIILNCSETLIIPPTVRQMTVCVPAGQGRRETRVINESEWPYYQSIGAVPGPCPVQQRQMTICVNDPYSPTGSQTLIIPESEWPYYQSRGASLGACVERMMTICTTDPNNPTHRITMQISESAWPYFQAQGAVQGACPPTCTCLTICMIDPNAPGGARTLTIRQDQWPQYQAQGAVLGPCNDREMLICFKEPCSNQPGTTMMIKESAWPYYQARGATRGPCPENTLTVCLPDPNATGGSRTVTIREDEWPRYQSMGATWGSCSNRFITICFPQPNGDRVTMSISESAWPYYQSRGAIRGICPPETFTICVPDANAPNGSRTMTISEAEWPYWQNQGAVRGNCSTGIVAMCRPSTQIGGQPTTIMVSTSVQLYFQSLGYTVGPCPPQQMTICMPNPNAPGGSVTMVINQVQWSNYQAQGAVQGPCGGEMVTICYRPKNGNPTNMEIPASMLPWYLNNGATRGPCAPELVTLCMPDPSAPGGSRQLNVPADQVNFYLNQGAVRGACAEKLMEICWKDPANPGTRSEVMIPTNLWPWYQSHGGVKGKCPEEQIKICLPDPLSPSGGRSLTIPRSDWPRYEAMGAIQGNCAGQMVICYPSGTPPTNHTITIFANLWPWYQSHGSVQGPCPEPMVVLCMPDASAPNGARQITVKESEVARYESMGATKGPCSEDLMTICVPSGSTTREQPELIISASVWPWYQQQGATQGPCPEKRMEICVPDPTAVSGSRTITIPVSMWPNYQAQGAVQGPCGTDYMQICLPQKTRGGGSTHTNNAGMHGTNSNSVGGGTTYVTMTIPTSLWPHYQAQGATQGKCPEVTAPVVDSVQICMPDMNATGGGRTMTVPRSQLASYISQGAVEGRCQTSISVCLPAGVRGRSEQTVSIPANLLPYYQNLGATTGPCPEPQVVLCLPDPTASGGSREITVNSSEVAGYQAQGAVQGPCSATFTTVCWPDPNAPGGSRTLQVPDGLLNWYLNNGATAGQCPEQTVVLCLPDPNATGGSREITVPQSQVATYQAQGATVGRCDANQTVLCYNGSTVSVSNTVVSWYTGNGATTGQCPEAQITICVPNPNAPTGSSQMTIAQSQWPTYQAQGAVQGPCASSTTTMCYQGSTVNVANNLVTWYTLQGATNGQCPEPTMTICMPDPNGTGGTQILTIPQSQWASYQAQGASQGPCEVGDNTICYQGQNLGVYTPVLAWYLAHGATNGPCPEVMITICLPSPQTQGGYQELSIPQSQWPNYQNMGAVQGSCSSTPTTLCYQSQNLQIPSNISSWYLNNGATNGPCPSQSITICVPDANAPNGSREVLIPTTQWPTYQAQGAVQGPCNGTTQTICYNNSTMTVSSSVAPWYLSNGATSGACATSGGWDRSSISVTGQCNGDNAVFTVTNTGSSSNGNMQGPVDYRFFENNVLVFTGNLQLQGGQSTTLTRASNGMAIRLEVDQRPGHPGNSHPRETLTCSAGGRTNQVEKKLTICHIPPRNPRSPQTMEIKESEWSAYESSSTKGACDLRMVDVCYEGKDDQIPAASLPYFTGQGATQGKCPRISICNVPPANPNTPQNLQIIESEWANYQATAVKGSCDMRQLTICYNGQTMNVPTASWNQFYSKRGAKQGACPKAQITICHVPPASPSAPKTLTIDEDQWSTYANDAHRGACDTRQLTICYNGQTLNVPTSSWNVFYSKKGAQQGECPKPKISICHVPPANPNAPQNLSIDEDQWSRYANEGHKGACDMRQVTICSGGQSISVPTSSWTAYYSKSGATMGACPVAKISICHVPPANPAAPQNLSIDEKDWSRYANEGHKGACDMRQTTICYRNQNMNVPTSSWTAFYSKNGATMGACPVPKIKICNVPPADPSKPQNLEISESDWSRYSSTAHKGTCNTTAKAICYKGQNISVPTSSWTLFYSKNGATEGNCPTKAPEGSGGKLNLTKPNETPVKPR